MKSNRRNLLLGIAAIACAALPVIASAADGPPLKIGIVGSGRLGGTIGSLWVKAGHQVMFSGLDVEEVKKFTAPLGHNARAGTPKEAAQFGDVVMTAVPYSALPQVGRDIAGIIRGKIVLDASNPVPARDGEVAVAARAKGTGVASAEYLPGARLVRAFNSYGFATMRDGAHRSGERLAIPLAADDPEAMKMAIRLVTDAGFDPVNVGPLSRAKEFDPGTPGYGKAVTARELRKIFGLGS